MEKKKDSDKYVGWLNSDSFLKRAFAVYGYGIVAHLIVVLCILVLILVLSLLFGGIGMLFR